MDDETIELLNRTSNALERYNRHMKYKVFPTMHPSLVMFGEMLEEEADRQVERVEDVRKGRELPPEPKGASFPEIPEAYDNYRVYEGKKRAAKKTVKKKPV